MPLKHFPTLINYQHGRAKSIIYECSLHVKKKTIEKTKLYIVKEKRIDQLIRKVLLCKENKEKHIIFFSSQRK